MNQGHPVKARDSIAFQLLKTVFLFYIVITFALTSLHMYSEYMNAKSRVRHDLKVVGETFSPGLSKALWDLNLDQLKPIFLGMAELPAVIGVRIIDENGQEIASSGEIDERGIEVSAINEGGKEEGPFHYSFPLTYRQSGEKVFLGRATLYSSRGVVFNRVKTGFIFIIVNAVVKTAALWLLVFWVSRRLIEKPLEKLTRAVGELDLERLDGFRVNIDTKGQNELKALEDAFNSMAGKLLDSRRELGRHADEIARSKLQFQSIVDNATSVIFMKDMEGRYLLVNDSFESLFHVTRDNVIGMKDHDIFSKEMADKFRENDSKVAHVGEALKMEEIAPHDDGIHTYISVKFPIRDASGKIYAICGIATDITERKEAEELIKDFSRKLEVEVKEQTRELRLAKESAEEATILKDKFISLLSHDLRGPLSTVIILLDLVKAGGGDFNENRELLHTAGSSCGEMMVLIEDLLNMGMFKTGKLEPEKIMIDTDELGEKAMLEFETPASQKGIRLINSIPKNSRIWADRTLIFEVLRNLLSNAVKFCGKGDSIALSMEKGDSSVLVVSDTGVGIAPDRIDHIFSYEKSTSTDGTSGERGTGLGLPLCRDIMEAHGGSLSVKSTPGKGSTFYAGLPLERPGILEVGDEE